ncbi:hypothetical protein [Agriterribacter sp.]|uniref:hypothetical protein n=1 Tax=Agriterribacter sp. TaxID=2821509 RepID=UPI002B5ED149|nr:hypothetical protein [Agriterribacter sp.]HRO45274.1 hypothetical protein [Agriterribacter sp.]HRQ16877.1 hypothetical protein [Agriterribacter sp.]
MEDEKLNNKMGAVLKNREIISEDGKASFVIPEKWIKWHNENETYPNLHLSIQELSTVKNAEGEWDKEFATYVNYLLPFENCFAHVGAEGWGSKGLSFADLQVRAYVFRSTSFDISSNSFMKKLNELPALIKTITPSYAFEKTGDWNRLLISYRCTFIDYSAVAFIDFRVKSFDKNALVFVFMFTDHTNHTIEIDNILNSSTLKD